MSFFMFETIAIFLLSGFLFISPVQGQPIQGEPVLLAQKDFSLTNRYPDPWVNEVFADNIVLTLHYLKSDLKQGETINWRTIREPFEVKFSLKPGEVFAFHNDALPEFEGKVVKTTQATFNWQQGFRSDGWLVGDGVCQLASFINLTATEAGLTVLALANHNFAPIPDIPREFGTSIFYLPGSTVANAGQNLYITNNQNKEVTFTFSVTPEKITLKISK